MKKLMNRLWKEEEAQGMLEYILIVVAVVIIASVFKDKIRTVIEGKLDSLGGQVNSF